MPHPLRPTFRHPATHTKKRNERHDNAAPGPAQHRHHRPRRSWQDDARRQDAGAGGNLRQAPAHRRTDDGQQRPRARTRHHHPGQELLDPLRRHPHQHRRHAGSRRFRRRGGAHPGHGQWRAAAGRCRRRTHAADALRHDEGVAAGSAADRRREQGRPPRRASGVGRQPDVRPLRQAGRDRRAARLPGGVCVGVERMGDDGRQRRQGRQGAGRCRHARAVRNGDQARARAGRRFRRSVPAADLRARLFELCGTPGDRPHPPRAHRAGPGSRRAERPAGRRRNAEEGEDRPAVLVPGHGARSHRNGGSRRHRAGDRRRGTVDRHDAGVARVAGSAAADHDRRAHAVDVLPGQHVAAGRPRRQVRHVAQPARPPRQGNAHQHGVARRGDRRHRRVPGLRAAASCT